MPDDLTDAEIALLCDIGEYDLAKATDAQKHALQRLLAAGFVDLVIETNLKPHDVVALAPIVEGAGGVMTTWDGDNAAKGGRIIAAGDPRLYEAARAVLLAG